jgi:hypothetical protein
MIPSAMIYAPSLKKIDSGIQKLIWGEEFAEKQHGELVSLHSFSKNMESRLKPLTIVCLDTDHTSV